MQKQEDFNVEMVSLVINLKIEGILKEMNQNQIDAFGLLAKNYVSKVWTNNEDVEFTICSIHPKTISEDINKAFNELFCIYKSIINLKL